MLNSSSSNVAFSARPSVAKRYSAPGPVSAAITCLGIAVAAVPHRQRPGQVPYAQNADLNF